MFKGFKNLFKGLIGNKEATKDSLEDRIKNEEMDQDELDMVSSGLDIHEQIDWCSGNVYCHMITKDPDQ